MRVESMGLALLEICIPLNLPDAIGPLHDSAL
jgi:hypothetical protein